MEMTNSVTLHVKRNIFERFQMLHVRYTVNFTQQLNHFIEEIILTKSHFNPAKPTTLTHFLHPSLNRHVLP